MCACTFSYHGCSSLEPRLCLYWDISSARWHNYAPITHTHTVPLYMAVSQLGFISNVLNLSISEFIVIHFTVIRSTLWDLLSLQARFPRKDCVCDTHTHSHTNLLFQQQGVYSPWIKWGHHEAVQFFNDRVLLLPTTAKFSSQVIRCREDRKSVV